MSSRAPRSRRWIPPGTAAVLGLTLVACSGDASRDDAGRSRPVSSSNGTPSVTPSDWTPLIEGTWSLEAGTEGYWCAVKTIEEDLYVSSFRAKEPTGTHHTLVYFREGGGPDGESACGPALPDSVLFASGVGTDDFSFPPGVALKIPKGSQLSLNLHLFNATPAAITGVSGTLVRTIPAAEQLAEMILPGSMNIALLPKSPGSTSGSCRFPGDATILSIWPHMHQLGTHMEVIHKAAEGDVTLHDADFDFREQRSYPIEPRLVRAGEQLRFTCSYQNTTNQPVSFGDSSEAEMCFVGLYRYPTLSRSCE